MLCSNPFLELWNIVIKIIIKEFDLIDDQRKSPYANDCQNYSTIRVRSSDSSCCFCSSVFLHIFKGSPPNLYPLGTETLAMFHSWRFSVEESSLKWGAVIPLFSQEAVSCVFTIILFRYKYHLSHQNHINTLAMPNCF